MIASPTPSHPWSAFLLTGQGTPVKVPQHVGPCPNCGQPARANLATAPRPGVAVILDIVCEGGCGLDEEVRVELKPVAREVG